MHWPRLRRVLEGVSPVTDGEFDRFCALLVPMRFKKKQHVFTDQEVCRRLAFVNEGCLRYYLVDNKAEERIIYFAQEDWWVGDMGSFFSGNRSLYSLQAMEPSELLTIDKDAFETARAQCPVWEAFYRIKTAQSYSATTDRYIQFQSLSAEEKYLQLMKKSPWIFQRIPQHQIAIYLGMKPQSLSRIRKQLAERGPIS